MSQQPLMPPIGSNVKLAEYAPGLTGGYDKDTAKKELKKLHEKMALLQEKLYAEGQQSLLIILQAMDAGGKDGTIKKVFHGVNPQGVYVASFKAPTAEELAHDFLWRIHQHTPPKGYIGIFNRSHYEDVLIVRVNNIVPPDVWEKRYSHINNFERVLFDSGTHILKFYLHISKDEQKARLQARLDNPEKHWKFSTGDLPVRQQWDQYMEAYETILEKCHHAYAPWHIIPANNKWYRDLVITQTIIHTLEKMNAQYPPAEVGLDKVVIPD